MKRAPTEVRGHRGRENCGDYAEMREPRRTSKRQGSRSLSEQPLFGWIFGNDYAGIDRTECSALRTNQNRPLLISKSAGAHIRQQLPEVDLFTSSFPHANFFELIFIFILLRCNWGWALSKLPPTERAT